MTAKEAYDLIRKNDPTYKATSCREYPNFFVFPLGGVNAIVVNKKSKNFSIKEMYDLPHIRWITAKL